MRFYTVNRHVILVPEVRTSVFCWPSVTLRGCFFPLLSGPLAQTPTGTRIRSGRFPCSNLLQDDVRSTLRSRGLHINCLEKSQAPHPK